ncbi:hypothetical protein SLEP1_g17100 [Rubroshorea leprosula]|uniref:Retrotransposon Copia-like N-terminal domain-containing protein n=1 Tax=Rubroshorea leprosula TaxID=152421 RepID=A0AAV5IZ11_9ROSI|nr:hypothetical protein SLEP1_g17100 [Rubroshorea leprosula]
MATPNDSPNSAASKTSTTTAITVLNLGLTNGPLSFNSTAFPMKLTPTNYLSWKAQFTSLLAGDELDGYLDGRHPCPIAITPEYSLWAHQDQLLRHALITSVSENITPYITAAATAQQAWETLAKLYANHSHTRLCGHTGYFAKNCPNYRVQVVSPMANIASSSVAFFDDCLLDSGVNNHVTTDLTNLALHSEYNGPNELQIGDGTGLKITHVGHSTLSTPTSSLPLRNDTCTGETLLKGPNIHGIYQVPRKINPRP